MLPSFSCYFWVGTNWDTAWGISSVPQTGEKSMHMTVADLEALIEEEKRTTCAECHGAAWAEGLLAGIEPEIIAEAALTTALTELCKSGGEEALTALLERMRQRVMAGDFLPQRTCH